MSSKLNTAIAVAGIDIGKNSFHVIGLDKRGAIVLRQKWSRGQVEARLANTPPCLIGMEACVGAHHLSRKLQALGHDARLMPAKYVRPYSKGQKNDFRDAEAIAEAVQRPTMRFVATKTGDQLDESVKVGPMVREKEAARVEEWVKEAEKRYDLSCLRFCVSAGEALPEELYRRWQERFGVEILDGIGTTEILHIFLSNRPGLARPGSTGLTVPGYEAIVVDDEGRPVLAGEVGNLRVKGDSIMAYYWNQHEKTKDALLGHWMQTGDKYYQDPDGYFWYCGRADDMLKVGGIWVSPVEVENTLMGHPAILETAVVGHADTDELIKPKAFVVLKDGHAASATLEAALKAFVKDKIAPYKYPRWIEFVPELPKTATGKIQRFKLRQ